MLYTLTFFVKARWLYNGYSSLIRRLSSFLSFHGKSLNFDCFHPRLPLKMQEELTSLLALLLIIFGIEQAHKQ